MAIVVIVTQRDERLKWSSVFPPPAPQKQDKKQKNQKNIHPHWLLCYHQPKQVSRISCPSPSPTPTLMSSVRANPTALLLPMCSHKSWLMLIRVLLMASAGTDWVLGPFANGSRSKEKSLGLSALYCSGRTPDRFQILPGGLSTKEMPYYR